jgi:hypothetical protein
MKKRSVLISMLTVVMILCLALPAWATEATEVTAATEITETTEATETTEVTEATSEKVTEAATETAGEESEFPINIGDVHEIVENSSSFSEAVLAIADRFGVSVEDAEKLVNDMKALGDKYLGESEIWVIIKNDMEQNPGKYVGVAMVILIILAIVAFMIKWIISNIGQMRVMKMDVASLKRSVDGDGDDEEGDDKVKSLRALICAKNNEISVLEEREAALEAEVQSIHGEMEKLITETGKVTKNTQNALGITQETALQIAQLLSIALDRGRMPVVTKEAKKMWYDNFQSRIKAAIEEGGEPNAEASEEVPKT